MSSRGVETPPSASRAVPSEPTCRGATTRAPAPASATIELIGVGKEFQVSRHQSVTALSGIDLHIASGGFCSLIGPSGCGKSTLLRILGALEAPSSGTVSIEGRAPAELVGDHRLGFAFQEHALLPWASVVENLALPFQLAHRSVDRFRIADLVGMIGLRGFENARPKHLSGGMRQRVSLARALALEPDVLLLDEPFGALDAITRRRLNFELARIWSETRVTTVLVTHAVDEAVLLSSEVVVMSRAPGRILRRVPIELARPRDRETLTTPEFQRLQADLEILLDEAEAGGR